MDYKKSNFLKHYEFQHHIDCQGKGGLSWINSITIPGKRQIFGGLHQLYLFWGESVKETLTDQFQFYSPTN